LASDIASALFLYKSFLANYSNIPRNYGIVNAAQRVEPHLICTNFWFLVSLKHAQGVNRPVLFGESEK
jgi:hypothetical protein